MRLSVSLSLIAVLLTQASPAAAAGSRLRLRWTAPPECPSPDQVHSAAVRDLAQTNGDSLEADAKVERTATAWKMHLRTRRGAVEGEREIEAATCGALADATAVLLALALGPPIGERETLIESPPAAPPVPAERPRPLARSAGPHALALGASLALDGASLPSPALGGGLTFAWTGGRARLELDARRWAAQSGNVTASSAGARFQMTSLGARACWAIIRATAIDASACAGGDLALVSSSGQGAQTNLEESAQWGALAAGALATVPLGEWFALRARLEAFVPLARPTFVIENTGAVHKPAIFGAAGSFGAEVRFF